MTTMQEFSRQSTGMMVSYLELGGGLVWKVILSESLFAVAISIVDDFRSKLTCALFHDLEDVSKRDNNNSTPPYN